MTPRKSLLAFLIIVLVLIWVIARGQTMQPQTLPWDLPMKMILWSRVGGEWLTITRHNLKDDPDGFHPCYTEIRCAYKPVVTRQKDGTYLIQFVSEITDGLP